jgi:4-hydroxymandelate oxidase
VLKGIMTAEDAACAVEYGVEGIIVSNHAEYQIDGTTPAIAALAEVVSVVNGRCEVYLEGGVREGTDILRALALGARAVLIGRPAIWGLAVNGEAGVREVLRILHDELVQALIVGGRPNIASIDSSLIHTEPAPQSMRTIAAEEKVDVPPPKNRWEWPADGALAPGRH